MIERRKKLLDLVAKERARQESLPGSEYDAKHSQNDWIAISTQYLARAASKKHAKASREEFNDSLIKAAAIILAALEYNS